MSEIKNDYIVRATAAGGEIRAFAAYTLNTVEDARDKHKLSPVATATLGRTLTGAVIMGTMLKSDDDLITIQINGDGPIGNIMVTANNKGEVKGFVGNPSVMLPPSPVGKLDVGGAVGNGVMTVIKDMGLKDPYAGQVILQTGEIAEDLTYYFATSEQIPSSVGLGVLMNRDDATVAQAGGFIVQLMPFASDETIAKLEENIRGLDSVTGMLSRGLSPEQMLETLLNGFDVEFTETVPVRFHCNCDRQRIEKALISIGKDELKSMIDDGKPITMNCHFCNTDYTFTTDELKTLLASIKKK
ncbi:MAG: Hsp33 family molecular chaperone HslO [Lachnospiraceae bacterium]|nr:Hsp33 family molecular chaperone HslO [Lachnospiraceae bacterium]